MISQEKKCGSGKKKPRVPQGLGEENQRNGEGKLVIRDVTVVLGCAIREEGKKRMGWKEKSETIGEV